LVPAFDIVRAAHVEFTVKDLERSRRFYVNALGFTETFSDANKIYLRGLEDRFSHSLILSKSREGEMPCVDHIAYRVRTEEDLDALESLFQKRTGKKGLRLKESELELGRGSALRAQDPFGFPIEFFSKMDDAEWNLRHFDRYRGARIMRIDHFNVLTPEVRGLSDWYTDRLGFSCSEFTETEERDKVKPDLWATWLRRKPTVHDIAIMTGEGPRLHHAGFVVAEKDNILDCADILASSGYLENMERGPGRHGISNAFFLYLRDPDGHRIELYTGDYLSADPDWMPLKWNLNDPQRQTFWGAPAPECWFREASRVRSFNDGSLVETSEPAHDPRKEARASYH
jgi:catechol 2,3-dioxygenase